jgi:hypothetical protein
MAEMFSLALHNIFKVKFNFKYSNIWGMRIGQVEEKLTYDKFSSEYNRILKMAVSAIEKAGIKIEEGK